MELDDLDLALELAFQKAKRGSLGAEAAAEPEAGDHVHKYKLLRPLGEGGMGRVFVAYDEKLEREVALKALHAGHRLSAGHRARFLREARLLSKLDHPNICRIYDHVQDEQSDYLILELVKGRDLEQRRARLMPERQVLELAEALLDALAQAHAANVVHRDLKPGNLMIADDGTLKILDFGIARSSGQAPDEVDEITPPEPTTDPFATQAGSILGTISYMSPEQARGEQVSTATDVFSAALILQELLTGESARPPQSDGVALLQSAAAGKTYDFTGISSEFKRLIDAMKSKAPSERPTASAALERVRWLLDRPKRRNRRLFFSAIGVLLVGLGIAYTVNVSAANAEANRRRGDVNRLMHGMVDELYEELDDVGQLHLLDASTQRMLDYFDGLPPDSLTRSEGLILANAYYRRGMARRYHADHGKEAARADFQSAVETVEAIEASTGVDNELLFIRGQAEFYVGELYFHEGDEASTDWFERYLATSEELVRAAPTNPKYQAELAFGWSNMGTIAESEGHLEEALTAYSRTNETWEELRRLQPEQANWKLEHARTLSWYARTLARKGDIESAVRAFEDEAELRLELLKANPKDATARYELANNRVFLGEQLRLTGRLTDALTTLEDAERELTALVEQDPDNLDWRAQLAAAHQSLADVHLSSDEASRAGRSAERALKHFSALAETEPDDAHWQAQCRSSRALALRALARSGQPDLPGIRALLDEFPRGASPSRSHVLLLLSIADSHQTNGRAEAAQGAREEALELFEERPTDAPSDLHDSAMHALVLHANGRVDEARRVGRELLKQGYAEPQFLQRLGFERP